MVVLRIPRPGLSALILAGVIAGITLSLVSNIGRLSSPCARFEWKPSVAWSSTDPVVVFVVVGVLIGAIRRYGRRPATSARAH